MSAAQSTMFTAASGQSPTLLLVGLASIATVIAFVFVAWTSFSALRAWQAGSLPLGGVLTVLVRGGVMLMFLGVFLR